MSRTLEFKLTRSPEEMFVQVQEKARAEGMNFTGDSAAGQFEGRGVSGKYQVSDGMISIHILKKPFVLPWGMVEAVVRTFFA